MTLLFGVTQNTQMTPVKKASDFHVPLPGGELATDSRMKATSVYIARCMGEANKNPLEVEKNVISTLAFNHTRIVYKLGLMIRT